jgi:acetyltransferase-like isoleucine patch superfamily enzyme
VLLDRAELQRLGFAALGSDVRIDRRAAIFGPEFISIGSHVRIDCFAVITAGPAPVEIGAYSHISANTYLSGAQGGIRIGYGTGVAPFVAIYSAVEDYITGRLNSPMVPSDLRGTRVGMIEIGPHAAIGSSSVLLSDLSVGFGGAVGALSLVNRSVRPFEVVHGNPIRRVGRRDESEVRRNDARLRAHAEQSGVVLDALPGQKAYDANR